MATTPSTGGLVPTVPGHAHRWRLWLALILLVVATAYAPSFGNGYTYDDAAYVQAPTGTGGPNPMVQEWQGLDYFRHFYGYGAVSDGRGYRPITVMSFAVVQALFASSDNPGGVSKCSATPHHCLNVLIHLAAVLVMFEILARFVGRTWPALLGAAVFGLHALRSDPVISTVGRAETMGFLFGAAALLCYFEVLRRRGAARLGFGAATAALLFLAFGSKESSIPWVVFLPLAALALGWQREEWRPLVSLRRQGLPILLFVVVPAAAFGLALYAVTADRWDFVIKRQANVLATEPAAVRYPSAIMILGYGLQKVLFPYHLVCDYSKETFTLVRSLADYRFWLAAVALIGYLVAGLVWARRIPLLFLSVATFFGFSFITSNLPTIIETVFAERLFYTPAAALSFLVAAAAMFVTGTRARSLRVPALTVIGLWLAMCVVRIPLRCLVWKSNETLFINDADLQPRSQAMQMAVGQIFRLAGQRINWDGERGQAHRAQWKKYLDRARAIDEQATLPLNDTAAWHLQYATWLKTRGQTEASEEQLRLCRATLKLGFASPQWLAKRDGPTMHGLMGDAYELENKLDLAVAEYQKAIECEPRRGMSYSTLADLLFKQKKIKQGTAALEEGLQRQPEAADIRTKLIDIALHERNLKRAEELLAAGEAIHATLPSFQVLRGKLLLRTGNWTKAVEHFEKGLPRLGMTAKLASEWMTLAAGLARIGRPQDAAATFQAIASNPNMPPQVRQDAQRELQRMMRGR